MEMAQVQAQGYIQDDGRFILNSPLIKLPTNRLITITWEDMPIESEALEKLISTLDKTEEQEIAERLKMLKSITGIIPSDFEFNLEDIRRERIEKRGLVQ